MTQPTHTGFLCPQCREYRNDPPGVNCFKPGQPCKGEWALVMTSMARKRWQVVVMPAKGHGDRRWTAGFRWKWEAQRFARDMRRIGAREAEIRRVSLRKGAREHD